MIDDADTDRSPTDEQIVHLLSLGQSQTQVAKTVGLSRETISRKWNSDTSLRKEVRRRCTSRMEQHDRRLATLMGRVMDKLERLLESDSEATQLRAAGMILARADFVRELEIIGDLEELKQWRRDETDRQRQSGRA